MTRFLPILFALLLAVMIAIHPSAPEEPVQQEKLRSTSSPHAAPEARKARAEYFERMYRDPKTGEIPHNIRALELAFVRQMETRLPQQKRAVSFGWEELGPSNVGGRTRALALDVTDGNTILAGGVAGGVWKSTDSGASWTLKSNMSDPLSCTALAQDTRAGFTHTWYYGTGEFYSSGTANLITGNGIYKSEDGGETWQQLAVTADDDPTDYSHAFDHVQSMVVSPQTGTLLVGSRSIYRSDDGGESFTKVLGEYNFFSHLAVGSNGVIMAAISASGANPGTPQGLYVSNDDGLTWDAINPDAYPAASERALIAFAPSDPSIAYVLVNGGTDATTNIEMWDAFYMSRDENGQWDGARRSNGLPLERGDGTFLFTTQQNYDVTLAVKPDDPNFVVYGGTNLFRTTDGFQTLGFTGDIHIGGYGGRPNHHPDLHATVFDPANPNRMWSGHDGGLSYTNDVTAAEISWETGNNGYNVTQFYHVAIGKSADDHRVMGGTQDNGTPFFVWNQTDLSEDVSGADGSWSYFGEDFMFVSTQFGRIQRLQYEENPANPAEPLPQSSGTVLANPRNAEDMLFINFFAMDPNDESIMYYPAGNRVWRNIEIDAPPDRGAIQGWFRPLSMRLDDYRFVSAMAVSHEPANRLYMAAFHSDLPAAIFRIDDAHVAEEEGRVDVSIPDLPIGTWIRSLVINEANGLELMAVCSNYNVAGLYHSLDGGESWTLVEGNLTGDETTPGPSIRSAYILPTENGAVYWLATSTGVYATDSLNGNDTTWQPQARSTIGNMAVDFITGRSADERVVVATHGRGLFTGTRKTIERIQPSIDRNRPSVINRRGN